MAAYRKILIAREAPDLGMLAFLALMAVAVYLLGSIVFKRLKYAFVDEL
jgi:ABC-type polysaccharide/polyol phosphate export permease